VKRKTELNMTLKNHHIGAVVQPAGARQRRRGLGIERESTMPRWLEWKTRVCLGPGLAIAVGVLRRERTGMNAFVRPEKGADRLSTVTSGSA
jgi:hypothetical protein